MYLSKISTVLLVATSVFAETGPEIAAYLRKHLSKTSEIFLPSESNYTLETTQRWNAFSAPTYVVSVKPATDSDVQKIVRLPSSIKTRAHHQLILTFSTIGPLCFPTEHIVSRHRRWAWLLGYLRHGSERNRD